MAKIKTTIYNKPVGYIAPQSNYNIGKKKEYANRINFDATKQEKGR